MVYFALTASGARGAIELARSTREPIWLNAGVVPEEDIVQLRADGLRISCFTHEVALLGSDALLDALATIKEHHPNETIWVEGVEQA